MSDLPVNESALEQRIKQLVKYMTVGLFCLLLVGVMSGITYSKVMQEKEIAQTNSQVQAETTKNSPWCSIYPDDSICKMSRSIAANPEQTVTPKDGENGEAGENGRGVVKFDKSPEGDLVVTFTDGTTQNVGRVVGENGINGIDGIDGRGVLTANVESGNLIIGFTDGTSQNLGFIVGPAGEDGVNGQDGGIGATGATGAQGDPGLDGAPGAAGADGVSVIDLQVDNAGYVNVSYSDGTVRPAGRVIVNTIRAISCNVDTFTLTMVDGTAFSTIADCTPDNSPVPPSTNTTPKP